MTEAEFMCWLSGAAPGAVKTYHLGLLARDRDYKRGLTSLASRVADLHDRGVIGMRWRRAADGRGEYMAVKL